jgi:hypothetical protein
MKTTIAALLVSLIATSLHANHIQLYTFAATPDAVSADGSTAGGFTPISSRFNGGRQPAYNSCQLLHPGMAVAALKESQPTEVF